MAKYLDSRGWLNRCVDVAAAFSDCRLEKYMKESDKHMLFSVFVGIPSYEDATQEFKDKVTEAVKTLGGKRFASVQVGNGTRDGFVIEGDGGFKELKDKLLENYVAAMSPICGKDTAMFWWDKLKNYALTKPSDVEAWLARALIPFSEPYFKALMMSQDLRKVSANPIKEMQELGINDKHDLYNYVAERIFSEDFAKGLRKGLEDFSVFNTKCFPVSPFRPVIGAPTMALTTNDAGDKVVTIKTNWAHQRLHYKLNEIMNQRAAEFVKRWTTDAKYESGADRADNNKIPDKYGADKMYTNKLSVTVPTMVVKGKDTDYSRFVFDALRLLVQSVYGTEVKTLKNSPMNIDHRMFEKQVSASGKVAERTPEDAAKITAQSILKESLPERGQNVGFDKDREASDRVVPYANKGAIFIQKKFGDDTEYDADGIPKDVPKIQRHIEEIVNELPDWSLPKSNPHGYYNINNRYFSAHIASDKYSELAERYRVAEIVADKLQLPLQGPDKGYVIETSVRERDADKYFYVKFPKAVEKQLKSPTKIALKKDKDAALNAMPELIKGLYLFGKEFGQEDGDFEEFESATTDKEKYTNTYRALLEGDNPEEKAEEYNNAIQEKCAELFKNCPNIKVETNVDTVAKKIALKENELLKFTEHWNKTFANEPVQVYVAGPNEPEEDKKEDEVQGEELNGCEGELEI